MSAPRTLATAVALLLALAAPVPAASLRSGALTVELRADPFRLAFTDQAGREVLDTVPGGGAAASTGALAFRSLTVWSHARRATNVVEAQDRITATLDTDDPLGRTIALTITPQADGVIRVEARGPTGAQEMGTTFASVPGERFLGFGERSDAVVRTGGTVRNRVTEGPFQDTENPFMPVFIPGPGLNPRHDATYFPIPWLLSSRGTGVLLRDDADSRFVLGRPWRAEVDGAGLTFEVFAGPTPAQALERFTRHVGRQPPAAAPFFFGPWWQPAHGDQDLDTLVKAGAAGSVAQTYTHYLPCGSQQGNEAGQRARAAKYHAAGLAVTTYFNPMICTSYQPRYDQAAQRGLLTRDQTGQPYVYRYTGSTTFLVGQFDFSQPAARSFYGDLLAEAADHGYDGWMEDFGEYTPDDARTATGQTGSAAHNRYVVDYHRAAYEYSSTRAPRPLARFNRSGWTTSAQYSQLVWGGDPTTGFGFDGLRSALRNGLSMGLSGVSLWGSDIGGYFALSQPQTTPDLLRRWIELGFVSGVMRTEADGFSLGSTPRAQITDAGVLPVWTRYAKLRTQLYPYLAAAQQTYDRTGLPIMRQLGLVHPDDPDALERDDELLFGPDILAAPVLTGGTTQRRVYLPAGRWIDWWDSVTLDADGAPHLRTPRIIDGKQTITAQAPADEIPLFVREGAAITLLPPDVRTLADYGAGSTVRLADRAGVRRVIAWPRAAAHGRRTIRVRQERRRRVQLELAVPQRPRCVTQGRKRVRFSYRDGVVRATIRARDATVSARRRC